MQTIATDFFLTLVGAADAERLIVRAGLAAAGGDLPATLPLPTFWRLCAENIRLKDDESHGVAPEPVPRGSLPPLFISAKEADTLGEALERLVTTAALIRKECRMALGRSHDAVHLTLRPVGGEPQRAEAYVECFAIVVHCALRWMTGRRLTPLFVRGAGALAPMGPGLLGAIDAPMVRKGAGVTLAYQRSDVRAPILARKYKAWGEEEFESFLALLHEHEDAPADDGPTAQTAEAVSKLLRTGLQSQEAVAGVLRCSVATLRRRLSAEGVNFRKLLADFRREQLQQLLATDASLSDIAEKIGLSEARSLRRSCHDIFGRSPRAYRRQLLDGALG